MWRRWLPRITIRSRRTSWRPCLEGLETRLAPAGVLSVADPVPLAEGDSGKTNLVFEAVRLGDTAAPLEVEYTTADGTAFAGIDYEAQSGTLHFAAGQTTATIAVPVIGNTLLQSNRAFAVNFSVPLTGAHFGLASPFPAGNSPYAVALGDVNGDGKPDLAVANQGDNTVSVLLNTTAVGAAVSHFAPQQSFATGTSPRSVALTDVNGDHRLDLLVANHVDDTVSVLLNTTVTNATEASFSPRVDFFAGSASNAVLPADVNDDGLLDLVVVSRFAFSVAVLVNVTPTGSARPFFSLSRPFDVGLEPVAVAAADFNGDGKPDLAVANLSDNTVSVLLNTTASAASVSFAPQQTFATGSAPTAVAAADVNGDGKPDLAVANFADGTISVLLNTTAHGAATASFAAKVDFAAGNGTSALTFGDLDGDGRPDLATADFSAGTSSVLVNSTPADAAKPDFLPRATFSAGPGPLAVALGDVNGDGRPDLATADFSSAMASVRLNTPASAFGTIQDDDAPVWITARAGSTPQTTAVGTAFRPLAVEVRNINGNLVQGASITFAAPLGTGRPSGTFPGPVSAVTLTTDASGQAVAPTFTANEVAGSYAVSAQADGAVQPVVFFNLTNADYVAPTVLHFRVRFGSQTFDLLDHSRSTTLPWEITAIEIVFSTAVTGTASSLQLSGIDGMLAVSDFSGSGTDTLTWTLATPITRDRVKAQLLAGDPKGIQDLKGHPLDYGTGFAQSFNVLTGDYDGDGVVTLDGDVASISAIYFTGPYDLFADLDGDGVVGLTDVSIATYYVGSRLP